MSTERVYNATKYSDLPSSTPIIVRMIGDQRASIENVYQTARLTNILLDVPTPTTLSNGQVGRLLREEDKIDTPVIHKQISHLQFESVGKILDAAIKRSEIARNAANARWHKDEVLAEKEKVKATIQLEMDRINVSSKDLFLQPEMVEISEYKETLKEKVLRFGHSVVDWFRATFRAKTTRQVLSD